MYNLKQGDSLELLKDLPDNSVDSIVTDPPYGLSFMGKKWDHDVPKQELWMEAIRVLKPGGHCLAFFGSRTYHRGAVEIEDAGFEIRDQIMWIYGQGFPKSHNIGKAVDKKLGNDREDLGAHPTVSGKGNKWVESNPHGERTGESVTGARLTRGQSEWEGWGTALKPAHEPIVVARKPFSGTVVDNVLTWGTGAINIDGSRIPVDGPDTRQAGIRTKNFGSEADPQSGGNGTAAYTPSDLGRFPANVIHDGHQHVLDLFPDKAGAQAPVTGNEPSHSKRGNIYGDYSKGQAKGSQPRDELGSAARFFYCAKASKKERNAGAEVNNHPTVKPIALMEYLVKLVTPAGGVVLDPFMGSGSTGCASVANGFSFIGFDLDPSYVEMAEARIQWHLPKTITADSEK